MVGKKFGRLTVLKYSHKDTHYFKYYECLCDCGNTKTVREYHLKNNKIESCGCLRRERSKEVHLKDITGQKFGRLTAIFRSKSKLYSSYKWYCVCDCGNVNLVATNSLISGGTKSCGCLVDEFIGNLNKKPSTQLGFACYSTHAERLKSGGEEVKLDDEVEDALLVRCFQSNCKKWFRPSPEQARRRIQFITGISPHESRFYCSNECKAACSIYKKSEKAILNRLNGKQSKSRLVQKELKQLILERDHYQCVKCGSVDDLRCHHIKPVTIDPIESADLDNCVTLCKKCHKEIHSKEDCKPSTLRQCA